MCEGTCLAADIHCHSIASSHGNRRCHTADGRCPGDCVKCARTRCSDVTIKCSRQRDINSAGCRKGTCLGAVRSMGNCHRLGVQCFCLVARQGCSEVEGVLRAVDRQASAFGCTGIDCVRRTCGHKLNLRCHRGCVVCHRL